MKKIVLFTANLNGGILQFTEQIYHTLKKKQYKVCVFAPEVVTEFSEQLVNSSDYHPYKRSRSIVNNSAYRIIADAIIKEKADCIWFMDDTVIGFKVGLLLNKQIKQILTLHDAGSSHASNDHSLQVVGRRVLSNFYSKKYYKNVYRFVLLSKSSNQYFCKKKPQYSSKAVLLPLGAHVPEDECQIPKEMENVDSGFLLFFGRIDKYKGLKGFFENYMNIEPKHLNFVIAGKGEFSDDEKEMLPMLKNTTVINRYISNGEMKWLFSKACALVLPYIEATQSGVIPLAYYYGKPVLVSDIDGLTEFVEDRRTGFICRSSDEWKNAISTIAENREHNWASDINTYYAKRLDWDNNIDSVLSTIEE